MAWCSRGKSGLSASRGFGMRRFLLGVSFRLDESADTGCPVEPRVRIVQNALATVAAPAGPTGKSPCSRRPWVLLSTATSEEPHMEPLGIPGAWVFAPRIHADDRGSFAELFRAAEFCGDVGHQLDDAQANCSVSRRGVIRGIHYADVPPGQAKYVTCLAGTILDVVVDLRTESPSFGKWEAVRLDAVTRRAVFLAEGLGHAFTALTDGATALYLCSTPYT